MDAYSKEGTTILQLGWHLETGIQNVFIMEFNNNIVKVLMNNSNKLCLDALLAVQ